MGEMKETKAFWRTGRLVGLNFKLNITSTLGVPRKYVLPVFVYPRNNRIRGEVVLVHVITYASIQKRFQTGTHP